MMLFRASVSFAALLYGVALGQTPSEVTPRFEVADIHGSPRTTQPRVQQLLGAEIVQDEFAVVG
jgi:hypothetical protein